MAVLGKTEKERNILFYQLTSIHIVDHDKYNPYHKQRSDRGIGPHWSMAISGWV
jgi:hypothetical protein